METNPTLLYRVVSRQFPGAERDDLAEAVREAIYVALMTVRDRCIDLYNAEAFMVTVARRAMARELRRQRRLVRPDKGEHISWESVEGEFRELPDEEESHAAAIDAADIVRAMPANYAEVMRLYYLEGLTHEQVAERIGVSPQCARKRHERAIKWARKTFGE